MTRTLSVFGLVLLTAATAAADDVRSIPLVLYPPAASSRSLQCPLLPELRDTIPGNAVTHYRQAIKNMKRDAPPSRDWYPDLDQWMAAPLKNFPREEVAKFLKQCDTTFQELDAGARSEDYDWGLTKELRKKGFGTDLLPDMQQDACDRRPAPAAHPL